jgi:glycine cleavage system H lipoate-binding protein
MVFLLVFLTVAAAILVNYLLHRENRLIKEKETSKKSPIFLSPDKALIPLVTKNKRYYHVSHSWITPSDEGYYYVGYDRLIPTIFSDQVHVKDLPLIGTQLQQGSKLWDVEASGKSVSQGAPISGEVVDINPACNMDISLPADQLEKSWILKIKADKNSNEMTNLMDDVQERMYLNSLTEEIRLQADNGMYMNDGGKLSPDFVKNMDEETWENFIKKFFPTKKTGGV